MGTAFIGRLREGGGASSGSADHVAGCGSGPCSSTSRVTPPSPSPRQDERVQARSGKTRKRAATTPFTKATSHLPYIQRHLELTDGTARHHMTTERESGATEKNGATSKKAKRDEATAASEKQRPFSSEDTPERRV